MKEIYNPSEYESMRILEKRAFVEGWPIRQESAYLSRSHKIRSLYRVSAMRSLQVEWLRVQLGSSGTVDMRALGGSSIETLIDAKYEPVALSKYDEGDNSSVLAILGEGENTTSPHSLLMVALPPNVALEFSNPLVMPGSCVDVIAVPDDKVFLLQ